MEADGWKKHPDKIPEKVKAARKKQEEKKTIVAAAAEDEVIFTVDITNSYHQVPFKDYEYFSDCNESFTNKSEDDGNNDDNSNDASKPDDDDDDERCSFEYCGKTIRINKRPTQKRACKSFTRIKILSFDDEIVGKSRANSSIESTLACVAYVLDSEALWIADMGATSHVTKYVKSGIHHCNLSIKMRRFSTNNSITASIEMDIPVVYCDKDVNKVQSVELKDIQVNKRFNFNLFSVNKVLLKGYKLKGNDKSLMMLKG